MPTPVDRADRDAARLRLDVNAVVVAGAGTGKTTLLTDRILFNLLGRTPALPITALVALTFTEKAAGEIRLRLADRLLELVALLSGGQLSEAARERAGAILAELEDRFSKRPQDVLAGARAALEDLDKAQIGTIHSFAAHILRLYPLQARMDPGFRVDEGPGFEELFQTLWSQWLETELGEQPPRKQAWLEVLRWASLEELEELARGLCAERVDLCGVGGADEDCAKRLSQFARTLRQAPQGQPACRGKIKEALEGLAGHLERLAKAATASEPALGRSPRLDWPEAKWPASWDISSRPAYEEAQRIASLASAEGEALARRAGRLLIPFARDFRRAYSRAGLVSFDGLLLRARDLVRDEPAVREELKAKYLTFLVDEFQDTDPLQGELLVLLAEEPGGKARCWQEVVPGPGRLFLVGDPKQSIYRFRGADIAAYQAFTEHLLACGALSCELKANFRSTAGVLEPVNAIFPKLMAFAPGSQPGYVPISAQRDDAIPSAVEIVQVGPAAGSEEPDAASSQKAQASWIASWISAECGRPGGKCFKDVAVLMRTSSALAPLLDAFKAAGIPYAVEMEKLFYGSQEIIDFLNLLRVLDDPQDKLSLAGLLRSPLLGLTDECLCRWAAAGKPTFSEELPASWPAEDEARLARLYGMLRTLRGRVGRVPLGEFVDAVLQETPLLLASARAYHGQQTVSNLLKFSRMAADAADARGLTLKEFITVVAQSMSESKDEGESPLADEHLDAVRVLSIHKAKGLEFPVVLLYNLSGGSARGSSAEAVAVDWQGGRAGLRLSRCGAASASRALWEARERQRQKDESVRLLYVAMTRAKEKLILLGQAKAPQGTLARLLSEAEAWPETGQQGLLPARSLAVGQAEARPSGRQQAVLQAAQPLPEPQVLAKLRRGRLQRLKQASARSWTLSPTGYLRDGTQPHASGSSLGGLVGQVCHKVLAGWDFQAPAEPEAAVAAACRSLRPTSPQSDWDSVALEAQVVLQDFLASAAAKELAGVEILGQEVPFVCAQDGAVERGTIDLVYRQDGRLIVADFKSEKVTEAELPRLREKYRRQGEDYCSAVAEAWGVPAPEFRLIFLRSPGIRGRESV